MSSQLDSLSSSNRSIFAVLRGSCHCNPSFKLRSNNHDDVEFEGRMWSWQGFSADACPSVNDDTSYGFKCYIYTLKSRIDKAKVEDLDKAFFDEWRKEEWRKKNKYGQPFGSLSGDSIAQTVAVSISGSHDSEGVADSCSGSPGGKEEKVKMTVTLLRWYHQFEDPHGAVDGVQRAILDSLKSKQVQSVTLLSRSHVGPQRARATAAPPSSAIGWDVTSFPDASAPVSTELEAAGQKRYLRIIRSCLGLSDIRTEDMSKDHPEFAPTLSEAVSQPQLNKQIERKQKRRKATEEMMTRGEEGAAQDSYAVIQIPTQWVAEDERIDPTGVESREEAVWRSRFDPELTIVDEDFFRARE